MLFSKSLLLVSLLATAAITAPIESQTITGHDESIKQLGRRTVSISVSGMLSFLSLSEYIPRHRYTVNDKTWL